MYYLPSLIKIAIANKINNTPIAIKIIDKIFEMPKSLSGKPPCTVIEFVLVVELFVVDVFVELTELEVFLELDVLEVLVALDVFDVFDVLDVSEVFDVLDTLDIFDVLDVFSILVSVIFISTAKTYVVKENNSNNIPIIKNIFKLLIIFYTSIKNKKIYLKFFTMISQIWKICLVFLKKCKNIFLESIC